MMKHCISLLLGLSLLSHVGFAQIIELHPSSVKLLNFSEAEEKEFLEKEKAFEQISQKVTNEESYNKLTPEEQKIYNEFDEMNMGYWSIIKGSCSWYCGGGPKKVTASSYLKAQGKNNYLPQNAHDLDYKEAWIEGVPGYGIGEYLLYTFEEKAPRITEIIVVNGYVKSQTAWQNNSRVKRLKVYLNNQPYAIFHLKDIRGEQTFEVEPIGNGNQGSESDLKKLPDWTLKFEILDVYKGLKYDDTVISEIYFNGIDVH